MAATDLPSCPASRVDSCIHDQVRIPTAVAIEISVAAFREFCISPSVSVREPNVSAIASLMEPWLLTMSSAVPPLPKNFLSRPMTPPGSSSPLSKYSERVLTKPAIDVPRLKIPAALTPAKMAVSPPPLRNVWIPLPTLAKNEPIVPPALPKAEAMLEIVSANPDRSIEPKSRSPSLLNASAIHSRAPSNESPEKMLLRSSASRRLDPAVFAALPRFHKNVSTWLATFAIPPRASVKMLLEEILSSRPTSQSPIAAARSRTEPAATPIPPKALTTALPRADRKLTPILTTANRPANTRVSFSVVAALGTSLAENSEILLVMFVRVSTVIGGNTRDHASPIEPITAQSPLKALLSASMTSARPPASDQPWRRLLRASVIPSMIGVTAFLIPVKSSVASSKSPNRISNVCAHPEPMDSPMVPRSCVKVRTFVAASSAIFCSSWNILICSSESPMAAIWASSMSPAMIWR